MSDKIHFIFTGGTIDGVFNPSQYKPVPSEKSNIPNYLLNYVKFNNFTSCQISAIDGLDMTDDVRDKIINNILETPEEKIIITHGTDNMVNTARYINDYFNCKINKTVIFVGAMHPLSFLPSDGGFNLGFAVAKLNTLKAGVYICMNAKIFNPMKTNKNNELSLFEEEK